MLKNLKNTSLYLVVIFTASSCSDYKQLKDNTPPSLKLDYPISIEWQSEQNINQDIEELDDGWVRSFNDKKIIAITAEILKNNQDLKAASANVTAAEFSAKKAGALAKPNADLNLSNSESGDFTNSDSNNNLGASLDISWEIDLWGKLAADEAAALASYEATKEDYLAAEQSLIAQGVKAYLSVIETAKQQEAAKKYMDSYAKDLKINEAFYESGAATKQDIYISKSNLASAKNDYVESKKAHIEAVRSLEILLGRYPSGEFAIANNYPALPAPISIGLPSDLLENRPDIIAAEFEVATSFAQTSSAKAAKLPRFSLTNSYGSSSDDLSNLADPENLFWNLAGNLLVPLFNNGTLQDDVEISEANQLVAIANYQSAALNAFNDVEQALTGETTARNSLIYLEENYQQTNLAYQFENSKYLQGEGSILDLSELKRAVINAEKSLIRAEYQLLSERVNLYLALAVTPL